MQRLLFFLGFLLLAHSAYAASLATVFPETLSPDHVGMLRVFLNTEGVAVNTVAGSLTLPEGILPQKIETGSSALTLWVSEPTLSGQTVSFAGAIPNGLSSSRVPLFDVVFTTEVFTANERPLAGDVGAFLNAPQTSRVPVLVPKTVSWSFSLATSTTNFIDRIEPESFTITVLKRSDLFLGKTVAIFSTVDKQSGVDYFEVQEHRSPVPVAEHWVRAESPVVVADDIDARFFSVKAVDRAGNVRVVTRAPLVWKNTTISVLALLFVLAFGIYVATRRTKRN